MRDALQVTTSFGIIIPLVGDLSMIAKGNVKIGIEWRFGADWPGQRCGIKHLNPRKIKVQVTAVTRPCITSNPLFNGRVFSKSCPRNIRRFRRNLSPRNFRHPVKNIHPLHQPKMQEIYENPVFGQFISIPAIEINNPHITGGVACGHPHETASWGER